MLVDMDDFIDFVKNKLGESIWVPLYKNLNKEDFNGKNVKVLSDKQYEVAKKLIDNDV